jgi:hypothetical protein
MAQTVGVSRSSVSRQAVQASAEQLKSLREKRWDTIEILALPSVASLEPDIVDWLNCRIVIYIDGQRFGAHHIISAAGVDREGRKHIPGLEAGATENAAAGSNRRRH